MLAAPGRSQKQERLTGRAGQHANWHRKLVGRRRYLFGVTTKHRLGFRPWEQNQTSQQFINRMQTNSYGNYHPKIATSAPKSPEQLGVFKAVCYDNLAVGEDDFGLKEVVQRQTVSRRQRTITAPQTHTDQTNRTNRPCCRSKSMRSCRRD